MKCFLSVSETDCRFYISDEKDKVTEKVGKLLQVRTICVPTSLSQPFFLLKYEESENAKAPRSTVCFCHSHFFWHLINVSLMRDTHKNYF